MKNLLSILVTFVCLLNFAAAQTFAMDLPNEKTDIVEKGDKVEVRYYFLRGSCTVCGEKGANGEEKHFFISDPIASYQSEDQAKEAFKDMVKSNWPGITRSVYPHISRKFATMQEAQNLINEYWAKHREMDFNCHRLNL